MRESIHFNYDGIASENMGVHVANVNSGLYSEQFAPSRKIIEQKTPYTNTPYFQGFEYETLSFPITLFISEWRDRDNLREIARWLYQDDYKPLLFDNNTNRVMFAIFEGSSEISHNGMKDGYVTLNVRCDSPYRYSHLRIIEDITDGILIYNDGDFPIRPKMTITKTTSQGNITITNDANGQTLEFTDIGQDEILHIDFELEEIVSSYEHLGVYRYSDFNDVWLTLEHQSDNYLTITGDCTVDIEFRSRYIVE